MTCHDNLFADDGREVYRHILGINLSYIIRVIERINVGLPGAVESSNVDIMFFPFVFYTSLQILEYHIYSIFESDDFYRELERTEEF